MENLADKTVEVTLKKEYTYYGAEKKKDDKIIIREDMIKSMVRNGIIDPPKGWIAPGSNKKTDKKNEVNNG